MLQNAVRAIPALKSVKGTDDQLKQHAGGQTSSLFDEYLLLLMSAATQLNDTTTPQTRPGAKRTVCEHDVASSSTDLSPIGYAIGSSSNIDTDITDMHSVNWTNRNQPQRGSSPDMNHSPGLPGIPHMSSDRWYSLSDKTQSLWDQLHDKAKAIILGF